MNDIAELERRITAAFQRLEAGLERMPAEAPPPGVDAAGTDELAAALEAERTANAQLTERVRAIKEKQETMVGALEKKVARLTEQLDGAGADLQRLKQLNAELTEANHALSVAADRGLAEPDLINRSLLKEIEALRAERAAEIAEMNEILSELKPLIGEVA